MSHSSRRKRHARLTWQWCGVAAFCLLFFVISLASVVADLAAFRSRSWVEAWTNLVEVSAQKGLAYRPEAADWESAHNEALLAVSLVPWSASYHETLARVYVAKQVDLADGDPALKPFLNAAASEYQRAIHLRPTWPYGYLGHAYVLRRELRLDAEYERSLRAALQYGPWEPQLLMSVVDINIDILPRLQPATRDLVLQTLRRGQAWTQDSEGHPLAFGDQIWGRVTAKHREMVACGWLRIDTPLLKQRCQPLPAKLESTPRSTS